MKKLLALVAVGLFAAAGSASACSFHDGVATISTPTKTAQDTHTQPMTPKPTKEIGG